MTNLQMAITSGQVSAKQIEAHRQAGDLNVTTQQAMPDLPDTSFLGDGISYGYDDGDMHAYAKKYAAQHVAELEAKLEAAEKEIDEIIEDADDWAGYVIEDNAPVTIKKRLLDKRALRKALNPKGQL